MELDLTKYKVEVLLEELDNPIIATVIATPGLSLPQDSHKLVLLAIDAIEEDEDNVIWDEPLYDDGIAFNQVLAIKLMDESPLDSDDDEYDPCEICHDGQVVNHIIKGMGVGTDTRWVCQDCFDDYGRDWN